MQVDADEFEETLLYVHQEKWQRDLMHRYANNVTLGRYIQDHQI